MKKILLTICLIFTLVVPVFSLAADASEEKAHAPEIGLKSTQELPGGGLKNTDSQSVRDQVQEKIIPAVAKYIGEVVVGLAVLVLVWAGVQYVTAGGDEGKVGTAHTAVKLAVASIFVVIFSYSIVKILMSIFS